MKFDTEWPADSVEFCSHPACYNIFVCGTYKLEQAADTSNPGSSESDVTDVPAVTPRRLGKCLAFEVSDDKNGELTFMDSVDMPAVLDMKWAQENGSSNPVLAIAEAEGHILTYEWDINNCRLSRLQEIECRPPNVLCLSLDWSCSGPINGPERLAVSSSDGNITLLGPDDGTSFTELASWHAHEYEPWIVAWDKRNTNIVYSGGDDLKLKCWDIRAKPVNPLMVNSRFGAGVTSIQSHPHLENVIAVGSYDSIVRIFDSRRLSKPVIEMNVGGGVWRIKWHPSASRKNDALVACMHDGFKVVSLPVERADEQIAKELPSILARNDSHASLAYGADWSYAPVSHTGKSLVASCSFYDHMLQTWYG